MDDLVKFYRIFIRGGSKISYRVFTKSENEIAILAQRYTLQPRYCNLYFVTMLLGHITVFSIKVAHKPYQT